MRITVVTLFPEAFESALAASLLGKARAAGLLTVDFVNPRDFTSDRHRSVDDAPYGGGHGMVMKPQPLIEAIESAGPGAHRVLLTPVGAPLDQALVRELAGREHIVLVCGRYEGVDERVSRSRSATSSCRAASSPRSPSSTRSRAWCRACWARSHRPSRSPSPTAPAWSIRSTRGRPSSAAWRCQTCCSADIMKKCANGGAARRCAEPPRGGRICSRVAG
jgi:hypothetical protein